MRKAVVLTLALALLAGVFAGSAAAKKRKKPLPPPVTFEASGTIAVPDILMAGIAERPSSITANEFLARCGIPMSQGVDAYVVELSDEISKVPANARLSGSDVTGTYALLMGFYDADCEPRGSAGEAGAFDAGTKYILVKAYRGANVEFTLTAVELR
jgi:hypothetical protein